ncbi:hypothetical protein CHUAL_007971 [Chamberlinius hualienensis]
MTNLKRLKSLSAGTGLHCEFITQDDVQQMCPLFHTDDIEGALWVPSDGVVDPFLVCHAMIREAALKGVKVFEDCGVRRILTRSGRVIGVETNKGTVTCETFISCGGLWARNIGEMSEPRVKVPLHPCEHYYLVTKPVPGLKSDMPVVCDNDGYVYFREKEGRMFIGGSSPLAKPSYLDKTAFKSQDNQFQEDWDHFQVLLEQILHRVPVLGTVAPDHLYNRPEGFTPDGKWIIGEAPEVKNYFVASGTMSNVAAAGIGEILTYWLTNKIPPFDVCNLDIQRFIGLHNNRKFIQDRIKEVPGMQYRIDYPFTEFEYGRKLRMPPIYPRLKAVGAVFSQTMGYERPAYFDPSVTNSFSESRSFPFKVAHTNTFKKPSWFDRVAVEYKACREGVAVLDYSSFTKLELVSKGNEVVNFLQNLCSNQVDIPVGHLTHTGMQNVRGGYENDCSLARLAPNRYMMIAPTIQQARCLSWLNRHAPADGTVTITDITSMYTAICVMGLQSRALLAELTDSDMSSTNFPFFTFKEMDVGLASHIRVMNLTHTGELGWILYIPNEFALHVYGRLISTGAKYDIQHAGAFAMRTLRIEKFYAFWGQDLDTTTTPLECGRGFRVKYNKGSFIGRDALVKQQEEGVKRRYVQLVVENHDLESDDWPWKQEPIFRDGTYVGVTTTTCYGFTLEKQVCLGFVQEFDEHGNPQVISNDFLSKGNFEIEIAGKRFPVKVNLHSPKLPNADMESPNMDRYMATQGGTSD